MVKCIKIFRGYCRKRFTDYRVSQLLLSRVITHLERGSGKSPPRGRQKVGELSIKTLNKIIKLSENCFIYHQILAILNNIRDKIFLPLKHFVD